MNYCHNCHHWSQLVDRVFCGSCLTFWYANRRFPVQGETR